MPDAAPDLRSIRETLERAAYRQKFRRFDFFKPYPAQEKFFALGATKRERLFMAGTQVGKSEAGAFEATCHMTGEYPPWWRGKVFTKPTRGWMAGVTSLDVRNVQQKKLCGPPGVESEFGTGMIPKDAFADKPSLARGITDAYDQIQIKHKSGGVSVGHFKSYEQGRAKFQGDTIDWGWGDEESERQDVYDEFLSRLTGDGILFTTFTPLFGKTKLVESFTDEEHPDRGYVSMTLDEAEHFTAEEKARRFRGYKRHEQDARAKGLPMLGSGAIFLTPETSIIEPPIEHIPAYWGKLWGLDFGIGHPFAAVLILFDRDNDVIHVHHAIRMPDTLSLVHATTMKRVAAMVPVAWPRDGADRDPHSGEPLAASYKKHGLIMLSDAASWEDGSYSTEAGIQEWDEREKTGRLKVAAHLSEWLEERRFYHRKDGKIVKVKDDLMSATRVALMAKRFARNVGLGLAGAAARRGPQIADGVDFDVHASSGFT
jgi:phage terminase large subunit-like protein